MKSFRKISYKYLVKNDINRIVEVFDQNGLIFEELHIPANPHHDISDDLFDFYQVIKAVVSNKSIKDSCIGFYEPDNIAWERSALYDEPVIMDIKAEIDNYAIPKNIDYYIVNFKNSLSLPGLNEETIDVEVYATDDYAGFYGNNPYHGAFSNVFKINTDSPWVNTARAINYAISKAISEGNTIIRVKTEDQLAFEILYNKTTAIKNLAQKEYVQFRRLLDFAVIEIDVVDDVNWAKAVTIYAEENNLQ